MLVMVFISCEILLISSPLRRATFSSPLGKHSTFNYEELIPVPLSSDIFLTSSIVDSLPVDTMTSGSKWGWTQNMIKKI
jgi:hypothetical protein